MGVRHTDTPQSAGRTPPSPPHGHPPVRRADTTERYMYRPTHLPTEPPTDGTTLASLTLAYPNSSERSERAPTTTDKGLAPKLLRKSRKLESRTNLNRSRPRLGADRPGCPGKASGCPATARNDLGRVEGRQRD
jgi:hypothetical protein